MKTIKASEFKARCLQLMDEVAKTGKAVIITKNGKPVSQLLPYRPKFPTVFGALQGTVTVKGDILAPVEDQWEALQ